MAQITVGTRVYNAGKVSDDQNNAYRTTAILMDYAGNRFVYKKDKDNYFLMTNTPVFFETDPDNCCQLRDVIPSYQGLRNKYNTETELSADLESLHVNGILVDPNGVLHPLYTLFNIISRELLKVVFEETEDTSDVRSFVNNHEISMEQVLVLKQSEIQSFAEKLK